MSKQVQGGAACPVLHGRVQDDIETRWLPLHRSSQAARAVLNAMPHEQPATVRPAPEDPATLELAVTALRPGAAKGRTAAGPSGKPVDLGAVYNAVKGVETLDSTWRSADGWVQGKIVDPTDPSLPTGVDLTLRLLMQEAVTSGMTVELSPEVLALLTPRTAGRQRQLPALLRGLPVASPETPTTEQAPPGKSAGRLGAARTPAARAASGPPRSTGKPTARQRSARTSAGTLASAPSLASTEDDSGTPAMTKRQARLAAKRAKELAAEQAREARERELMEAEEWQEMRRQWWGERKMRQGAVRTVRCFISSTFNDFHSERDSITRHVFPALNNRARSRGVRMVPVDLRWGLTSEQTSSQGLGALEHCLLEIEHSRPFFVALLGDRFGWIPDEYTVSDRPEFAWVRQHPPPKVSLDSITAMEIRHGLLNHPHKPVHGLCYVRNQDFVAQLTEDQKRVFKWDYDGRADILAKRDELREDCRNHRYCKYRTYQVKWGGVDSEGRHLVTDLLEFERQLLEDLWDAITHEFPPPPPPPSELEMERGFHQQFIQASARGFIGRQALLAQMQAQLLEAVPDASLPITVVAHPGSGKSALSAALCRQLMDQVRQAWVLVHVVGASPSSTDIREVLLRFIRELSHEWHISLGDIFRQAIQAQAGAAQHLPALEAQPGRRRRGSSAAADASPDGAAGSDDDGDAFSEHSLSEDEVDLRARGGTPEDYSLVKAAFSVALAAAGQAALSQHRCVLLVIDAVNQLDPFYSAHSMDWLPLTMPAGTALLCSCTPDAPPLAALQRRDPRPPQIDVPGLSVRERKELVSTALAEYRKNLTEPQLALVTEKPASVSPLYLLTLCEELRLSAQYGVDGMGVNDKIRSLPGEVPALLQVVLDRVELDLALWIADLGDDVLLSRRPAPGVGHMHPASTMRSPETATRIRALTVSSSGFPATTQSNDMPGTPSTGLVSGPSSESAPPESIADIAKQVGYHLVKDMLSLLVCSRHGLREQELLEMLAPAGRSALPTVVWLRMYRALELYLRPAGEEDAGTLGFFHNSMAVAARKRYIGAPHSNIGQRNETVVYAWLAQYFMDRSDPTQDGRWQGQDERYITDLVHYQLRANLFQELQATLGSLLFVQKRAEAGGASLEHMLRDYIEALECLRSIKFTALRDALTQATPAFSSPGHSASTATSGAVGGWSTRHALSARPGSTAGGFPAGTLLTTTGRSKAGGSGALLTHGALDKLSLKTQEHVHASRAAMLAWMAEFLVFLSTSANLLERAPWLTFQAAMHQPSSSAPAQAAAELLEGSQQYMRAQLTSRFALSHGAVVDQLTRLAEQQGLLPLAMGSPLPSGDSARARQPNLRIATNASPGPPAKQQALPDVLVHTLAAVAPRDQVAPRWLEHVTAFTQQLEDPHAARCTVTAALAAAAQSPAGMQLLAAWGTALREVGRGLDTGAVPRWLLELVNRPKRNRVLADFAGYASPVTALALTPNADCIAVGFQDGAIQLVGTSTGEVLREFTAGGHKQAITTLQFSQDGLRLVSGSHDHRAVVWDAHTGTTLSEVNIHDAAVTVALWIAPDNARTAGSPATATATAKARVLLTASLDASFRLWSESSAKRRRAGESGGGAGGGGGGGSSSSSSLESLWESPWLPSPVLSAAYNETSTCLVAGHADGEVRVYDAHAPTLGLLQLARFTAHRFVQGVTAIAWAPDGECFATGSLDCTVILWRRKGSSGSAEAAWHGEPTSGASHSASVTALSFAPNSSKLLSASQDKTLRVWDAESGSSLLALSGHGSEVYSAQFLPDGDRVVSGSLDRSVKVFAVEAAESGAMQDSSIAIKRAAHQGNVALASASKAAEQARGKARAARRKTRALGRGEGRAMMAAMTSGSGLRHSAARARMEAASSASHAAPGADASKEAGAEEQRLIVGAHSDRVLCALVSPSGRRAFTGGADKVVKVFDTGTGEDQTALLGHSAAVTALWMDADETVLCSGDAVGNVLVWDARTFDHQLTLHAHGAAVTQISGADTRHSASGAVHGYAGLLLYTACEAGQLAVWRVSDGQRWHTQPASVVQPPAHIIALQAVLHSDSPVPDAARPTTLRTGLVPEHHRHQRAAQEVAEDSASRPESSSASMATAERAKHGAATAAPASATTATASRGSSRPAKPSKRGHRGPPSNAAARAEAASRRKDKALQAAMAGGPQPVNPAVAAARARRALQLKAEYAPCCGPSEALLASMPDPDVHEEALAMPVPRGPGSRRRAAEQPRAPGAQLAGSTFDSAVPKKARRPDDELDSQTPGVAMFSDALNWGKLEAAERVMTTVNDPVATVLGHTPAHAQDRLFVVATDGSLHVLNLWNLRVLHSEAAPHAYGGEVAAAAVCTHGARVALAPQHEAVAVRLGVAPAAALGRGVNAPACCPAPPSSRGVPREFLLSGDLPTTAKLAAMRFARLQDRLTDLASAKPGPWDAAGGAARGGRGGKSRRVSMGASVLRSASSDAADYAALAPSAASDVESDGSVSRASVRSGASTLTRHSRRSAVQSAAPHRMNVRTLAFSADGHMVAAGTAERELLVYDSARPHLGPLLQASARAELTTVAMGKGPLQWAASDCADCERVTCGQVGHAVARALLGVAPGELPSEAADSSAGKVLFHPAVLPAVDRIAHAVSAGMSQGPGPLASQSWLAARQQQQPGFARPAVLGYGDGAGCMGVVVTGDATGNVSIYRVRDERARVESQWAASLQQDMAQVSPPLGASVGSLEQHSLEQVVEDAVAAARLAMAPVKPQRVTFESGSQAQYLVMPHCLEPGVATDRAIAALALQMLGMRWVDVDALPELAGPATPWPWPDMLSASQARSLAATVDKLMRHEMGHHLHELVVVPAREGTQTRFAGSSQSDSATPLSRGSHTPGPAGVRSAGRSSLAAARLSAKASKAASADSPAPGEAVAELARALHDRPRALIALFGGAGGLHSILVPKLKHLITKSISQVVRLTGAMLLDGGTDAGVMSMIGDALASCTAGITARAVGVAPRGVAILPGEDPAACPNGATLESRHTHFVLAPGDDWGSETSTMFTLAQVLSSLLPAVAVLANGGWISSQEVRRAVRLGLPVVVVEGSGRAADKLARAMRSYTGSTEVAAFVAGEPLPFDSDEEEADAVSCAWLEAEPAAARAMLTPRGLRHMAAVPRWIGKHVDAAARAAATKDDELLADILEGELFLVGTTAGSAFLCDTLCCLIALQHGRHQAMVDAASAASVCEDA